MRLITAHTTMLANETKQSRSPRTFLAAVAPSLTLSVSMACILSGARPRSLQNSAAQPLPFLSGLLLSQTQLLRQRRGFPYLWVDFACQRLQEPYQVLLLLGGEIKRPDIAGQPQVVDFPPIVGGRRFLQRFPTGGLDIGAPPGHLPPGLCFEGALIGLLLCYRVTTEVRVGFIHAHADIAVILVGEVEPSVTA